MTSATMIKILTGFALAVPVPCAAADEITVGQPRPLMALAGELAARYGYLVTYEDGPTDNADVLKEQRRNGLEYRYPKWKPVVFHVDAHEAATTDIETEEPLRSGSVGSVRVRGAGAPRPLSIGIVDLVVDEYNSSGNPGRFTVLYEGDYAHIVPAKSWSIGNRADFEPILSTRVPVHLQEGTCMDMFKNLLNEVQQKRKFQIQIAQAPTNALWNGRCSIEGHDLTARQVLAQLLDQVGVHPAFFGLSNDRFVWTFVYDPTTDSYWLATRLMPGRSVTTSAPNEGAGTLERRNGTTGTSPNPYGQPRPH